jgi:phage FluMu protein Com
MSKAKKGNVVMYGSTYNKCPKCKTVNRFKYTALKTGTSKYILIYIVKKTECKHQRIKPMKKEQERRIYIFDNISNF